MTNIAILLALCKIKMTMKQVNFLNARHTRILAKTYENFTSSIKAKTVAVTIRYTCLSFYIENVFGFTGNW